MADKTIHDDSSSSSSARRWNHDVFLSFSGEDTRKNFTDHLYTALVQAGIRTFRDDDELPRGKNISLELVKAIKESRVAIIVFSINYASSRWCLEELVQIVDCKNTMEQLVLPVFYDIDPCDVRRQTGSFAKSFAKHEERYKAEMEMVKTWRAALTEAANLSGWDLQNVANGHEAKFIQKIIEEVLRIVNHTNLHVAAHPVGIDSRVKDINLLLNIGSDDVRMIGIFGMGGIGKTTLAKAIYNLNFHRFEGSCFLANVREISGTLNGLLHLQEKLLSKILMKENLKIDNVDRGIILLKERLRTKRVFIVLDDLEELSQFNSLAGNRNWLGSGSRVIITTRDEHLLNELEVDERYEATELDHDESLQLFSWYAFRKTIPSEDFAELSERIISYAGGLPLALEVLGSYLFGRNMKEWKSEFEKLQESPNKKIQKILRSSYDALDDDKVKYIFLDIACFFIGMDKDYVTTILNGCGFFPEIGISVLTSRCLLKINENEELTMHDLVRDMGREIIHEESPKKPGKRSRLWFYKNVCNVLQKDKGTDEIEGVALLPTLMDVHLNTKAFSRMDTLRLLQMNYVHLTGSYEYLSKELKWLYWHNCNLGYLPSDFHLENLVVLDMQYSNVKEAWQGIKFMRNLKILNLSHSKCLTKTPDFTELPRLEKLLFEGCTSMFEVHQSIGVLEGLVFLNLKDCNNIRNLPCSICMLKSLERLNLTGCSNLERLPDQLGNMAGLKELLADGTAIKQLPLSFGLLKSITTLSLQGCNKKHPTKSWLSLLPSWIQPRRSPDCIGLLPPSISGLCSLRKLSLSDCNLSEVDIPVDLGSLASLQHLDLSGNKFHTLPSSLTHLSKLKMLLVRDCRSLQSLPELPPNLIGLSADDCTSLETFSYSSDSNCNRLAEIQGLENFKFCTLPSSLTQLSKLMFLVVRHCRSLQSLPGLPPNLVFLDADDCTSLETLSSSSKYRIWPHLQLSNCNRLAEIQGLENFNSRDIHMENCSILANNFKDSFFQAQSDTSQSNIYLPRKEIPDWFSPQRIGSSISFDMPFHVEHQFVGMTLWAVYASEEDSAKQPIDARAVISNKTRDVEWTGPIGRDLKVTREEHSWVSHIPKFDFRYPINGGERIEISIDMLPPLKVKKCGIHLVYKPNITEEDRGQSSCLNADNRDELMDDMNLKRGRDVETSCDLSNEDKFHKRMRMEPDQTKNLDMELDQLKK